MSTATALYASNPLTLNGAEKVWLDKSDGSLTGGCLTQEIANLYRGTKGAPIASAATVDLSTATGEVLHITGNTGPITSLGTVADGKKFILIFDSTPTLTHHATNLNLLGSANITAVAGDSACFVSNGSGTWTCLWYVRKSGQALVANTATACDFIVAISDETTAITTGTAKVTFRASRAMTISKIKASLSTASSSGLPTFDVKKNGVSMFSTTLTIDASEKTSETAATAAVLSTTAIAADDEITIDITTAGTGAKGAKITFVGTY